MSPFPTDTLEIDAQGRESLVLDVALPVLGAWAKSARVVGFRPSMGISGLSAREVARLRTVGLATGARATGVFEGANDFRMGFPRGVEGFSSTAPLAVEADLGGHPLAHVVSDLAIAAFGLPLGKSLTHHLRGFTHVRAADACGYWGRTLESLGRESGLDLKIDTLELGFEPQGLGHVTIAASRSQNAHAHQLSWKERGEVRSIHVTIGGVRPKMEQVERIEAELRHTLWEARRLEPSIERHFTTGVDFGAFLQMDVACDRGGATFLDVVGRSTAPLPLARRVVKKALAFADSRATCDEVTGIAVLSAAIAARASLEMALAPSLRLSGALALLRDVGAYIEESEAPGLVILKTASGPR